MKGKMHETRRKRLLWMMICSVLLVIGCISSAAASTGGLVLLEGTPVTSKAAYARAAIQPATPDDANYGFSITGLEQPLQFTPGTVHQFTVTGAHVTGDNITYEIGDRIWVPIYWVQVSNNTESSPVQKSDPEDYTNKDDKAKHFRVKKTFSAKSTAGITKAGTLNIRIYFRCYEYGKNASGQEGWFKKTENGKDVISPVNSKILVAAITPTPTVTVSPTPTATPTVTPTVTPTATPTPTPPPVPKTVKLARPMPKSIKASEKAVTFKWNKIPNARRYIVCRKSSKGTKVIGKTKSTKFTDKKPISGERCSYTVYCEGYQKGNITYKQSAKSPALQVVYLKPPVMQESSAGENGRVAIRWKSKGTVNGFQIRYSTNKDFSDAKSIKVNKTLRKVVIGNLSGNTIYYFQVRSYRTIKGKTSYSAWSSKKKVLTNPIP